MHEYLCLLCDHLVSYFCIYRKGKIKTGELMDKGNSEGREGAAAEEEGEESDDSILGDSSPFVRSFTRSEREREGGRSRSRERWKR